SRRPYGHQLRTPQGLSERRARAVPKLLVDEFGLDAKSVLSTGYGAKQLGNSAGQKLQKIVA
ncbi:MAG: OmpA family protein, partial [Legionella sp.]|nr:OmpA family protein [Legionella sp.]